MKTPVKQKKQPKPTNKKAKEISKSNFEVGTRERRYDEGPQSYKRNLPVALVKENGKKNIVIGKLIPDVTRYSGTRDSEMPSVNGTPKANQSKKVIKTYEGGKLVMKEKQGRDILNRPTVKRKTTGQGSFIKGMEKKTLTKKGVKTKSTY